MPVTVQCKVCGKSQQIIPARVATFKYCSRECAGKGHSELMRGENNPGWQGGHRSFNCQQCGKLYEWNGVTPYSSFKVRKFCSKECADLGGFRFRGESHWNYKQDARRRSRSCKQHSWSNAVISRDKATCQHCGATGVQLHAHHVKPYSTHPELRNDVANGITLCYACHWAVHTAQNDNGVNSGNISAGDAGDNPEPSPNGNIREGVTTRGRPYRRWEGHCDWCGCFISKPLSDVTGKEYHFCSYKCSGSHRAKYSGAFGLPKAVMPPRAPHAKAKI